MLNKREKGSLYEKQASDFLEQNGFEILERNFRCRMGEIDIIAKNKEQLIFCEVKYRKNNKMGNPLEAVHTRKQQTISKCAMYYVTIRGLSNMNCRFDVIGILGTEITWIPNAFEYMA